MLHFVFLRTVTRRARFLKTLYPGTKINQGALLHPGGIGYPDTQLRHSHPQLSQSEFLPGVDSTRGRFYPGYPGTG
eukprot:2062240-Rhodomonas_salina.1